MYTSGLHRFLTGAILIAHICLLAWGSVLHSPTYDEPAHLVAGLSHWELGQFDLYRVNPPLIRMIAAFPVHLLSPKTDWTKHDDKPESRIEFPIARDFIQKNGVGTIWYVTLARWACIPFSLLGAYICYRWARELHGSAAGLLALTLWCFCPNILGHGQLL